MYQVQPEDSPITLPGCHRQQQWGGGSNNKLLDAVPAPCAPPAAGEITIPEPFPDQQCCTTSPPPSPPASSSTPCPFQRQGGLYELLDVTPSHPPTCPPPPPPSFTVVNRVNRLVRISGALRTYSFLEPVHPGPDTPLYVLERILTEKTRAGVKLFLATPMRYSQDDGTGGSVFSFDSSSSPSPSYTLASGGPPCVIKASPNVVVQHLASSNTYHMCVDHPLREISAIQQLMQHTQPYGPGHYHPNVIHLLDCMQDDDYVYLVLPYLSGGDLFSRVCKASTGLPEAEAASYLRQMCEGLMYMKHSCGMAHHDVSLENVMLGGKRDQLTATIIDLGMCIRAPFQAAVGTAPTPPCASSGDHQLLLERTCKPLYLNCQVHHGKPAYVAPELLWYREDDGGEEEPDPFAADVWSLGVCLYTMLTGRQLYHSMEDRSFAALAKGYVKAVVSSYEAYGIQLSPQAKDLIYRMLDADSSQRPTLEEVLQHPFLLASGGGGREQVSWDDGRH